MRGLIKSWGVVQFLAIVILAIFSAVSYGIAHDQVTARICVEYFTIGHPRTFETDSPTMLALGWGIVATWWMGAILGVPLAAAARTGHRPKRSAVSLIRPLSKLLAIMAICAVIAGEAGYLLAREHVIYLVAPLASRVPQDRHNVFIADLWSHSASYIVGFIGGVGLIALTWRARRIDGFHKGENR